MLLHISESRHNVTVARKKGQRLLVSAQIDGPIICGGLGGSGTRAFAAVLRSLGVDMGYDLNPALDNLSFTLLFKVATLFDQGIHALNVSPQTVGKLQFFQQSMLGKLRANPLHWLNAYKCFQQAKSFGHDRGVQPKPAWTSKRWAALISGRTVSAKYWGFKEPNSHIYVPALLASFPRCTYIHVIRHGLDMACSRNKWQLHNWGPAFGIHLSEYEAESAAAFAYWDVANARIYDLKQQYPERIFIIKHEELCTHPRATITSLAERVKLPVNREHIRVASQLVKRPNPIHRYSQHDLSMIEAPEKALEKYGYS